MLKKRYQRSRKTDPIVIKALYSTTSHQKRGPILGFQPFYEASTSLRSAAVLVHYIALPWSGTDRSVWLFVAYLPRRPLMTYLPSSQGVSYERIFRRSANETIS
jgi:hypothetical protein